MKNFDLTVIGTGPGGGRVAATCRAAGWNVALVDKREIGGTCALRGCNPKKVLVRGAETADRARRLNHLLTGRPAARLDWGSLIAFKRAFTDPVPAASTEKFREKGITLYQGRASFTGPNSLAINDETIESRHICIAVGARPAPLPVAGGEHIVTSDDFLEFEALPQRILFIGGGYISFEFAHVAARAGRDVTVVEFMDRPLQPFDADLVDRLVARSREAGIDVRLKTKATAVERTRDGTFHVSVEHDGTEETLDADLVVHGAGRSPDFDGLALDEGRVKTTKRGVHVTDFLQSTSNPAVYAVGDAADSPAPPLTPVADYQGSVAAAHLLGEDPAPPDYAGVASAVFTVPNLAAVGLSEAAAREQGVRYELREDDMSSWSEIRKMGETTAAYKVLLDPDTKRILGAHLLGPDAAEVINLFALAVRHGLTADQVKSTLMVFPTLAYTVRSML